MFITSELCTYSPYIRLRCEYKIGVATMEKTKTSEELTAPVEERRLRTSFNIRVRHADALSKIADAKGLTKTDIIDDALETEISKFYDTTAIDNMLNATNGFWFHRDLEKVKACLSQEKIKLIPYKIAYLYCKLRNLADAQEVFNAAGLSKEMEDIDAVNMILDKAARISPDGHLEGYKLAVVANGINMKLSQLQEEYLTLKLGKEAIEKIKQRTIDKFPKSKIFTESSQEPSENPALETIFSSCQINEQVWKLLPDSVKKQIRNAVAKGQWNLAKSLVDSAKAMMEIENIEVTPE
jgi:hypothetical protein